MERTKDIPGGQVVRMLHPQCRGPRVQFPVRELDPTYCRGKFCMLQLRPTAAKGRKGRQKRRGGGEGGSEERREEVGNENRSHTVWEVRISYNYC